MGPYGELFNSSAEDPNDRAVEMLQKQNSTVGQYPQHMIQRAGEAFPEIFEHLNEENEAIKASGQQCGDWRWVMRELSIPEEDGAFLERVLKIDPEERRSAEELLKDKWLEGL